MESKVLSILCLFFCLAVAMAQVPGGLEEEKPADEHVNKIVSSIETHIKSKFPREYATITPVSYRTQVVAGLNYFIKAVVTEKNGSKSHVHLRVYEPFSGPKELTALRADVDKNESLKYFQ